jgi:hypothetical protein
MKLGMPILAITAHGFWMRSLDELWIQTLKTYPETVGISNKKENPSWKHRKIRTQLAKSYFFGRLVAHCSTHTRANK